MAEHDDDFFAEAEEVGDTAKTSPEELKARLNELITLDSEIEARKLELEDLNKRANELRSKRLPELLNELGTEIYRDPDTGYGVQLELAVNSKLPANPERKREILQALEPLGVNEIINDTVEARFAPGDNTVAQLIEFCEEQEFTFKRSLDVHASKLKSWLKEKIEAGKGVEITEAGIWHGRHAKLVKPKGQK